jgi:hypothetical protein
VRANGLSAASRVSDSSTAFRAGAVSTAVPTAPLDMRQSASRARPPNVRARSDLRGTRSNSAFRMIRCKPGHGAWPLRLAKRRRSLGRESRLPRLQVIVGRATDKFKWPRQPTVSSRSLPDLTDSTLFSRFAIDSVSRESAGDPARSTFLLPAERPDESRVRVLVSVGSRRSAAGRETQRAPSTSRRRWTCALWRTW